MRAAIYRHGDIVIDQIADPVPGEGQVLVKTLTCGICGSDLHARQHLPRMVDQSRRSGGGFEMDPARDVVFGHEFCAEILDYGPGTEKKIKAGTRVCSMPIAVSASGISTIGYSNDYPGGYAEQMVLNELLLHEVPNGLSDDHAALTEPMAVGWHAVEKANLDKEDLPLVIGCGPVGLAVIAALKLKGAGPIVAADYSPARRKMAETMGADIIIDPSKSSPYEAWTDEATPEGFDPQNVLTLLGLGPQQRPGVVFECVGVPGIIQQVIEGAMRHTRVIVVGVCMERDHLEPLFAINRELNLQFVLGYTPEEFAHTLHSLAEGVIDGTPMVTSKIGLNGVPEAFDELANPDRHAKILVEPWHD